MLNALIRYSLQNRALILGAAALLLFAGFRAGTQLPLEVLPDLTKPTVTILTEAPGLAPEEVEARVSQPLENAVQGLPGLDRLRATSDVGLSLVFVEFAWGTDLVRARQQVQERVSAVLGSLPKGVRPGLTPASALLGEFMLVGLRSSDGKTSPRDLRTLADWTLQRRLLAVPGVTEVLAMGGGILQVQVQPDPARLAAFGVTLDELRAAVAAAAQSSAGGYLETGPMEMMIRAQGMTSELRALGQTVVKNLGDRRVLLSDVARLEEGIQPMRGDAGVNGAPGVILAIVKAPGIDTLRVTRATEAALDALRPSLPPGVQAEVLFRQADFIETAIGNLREAIRDGAVMVAVVLLLFLVSLRPTVITLLAMPLSFAATLLVFQWLGISVNSMTLGGLAVAIGMVVDDAIVDVENVLRRLRENAALAEPRPRLEVIATASGEVRNSILYATVLIILVFLPLFGLSGVAGRLFVPIAVATIVSLAASFVVSLTVIPVLCSYLLQPRAEPGAHGDGWLVRQMKRFVRTTFLRAALRAPAAVLTVAGLLLAAALSLYPAMGRDFLPAFNESSAVIAIATPPGTSLAQSNEAGEAAVRVLQQIPEIRSLGRRTGRAERAEHVVPVSQTEIDVEFKPGGRPRGVVLAEIRERLRGVPGIFAAVTTPLADRIGHMLSGTTGRIVVKLHGPDLDVLRERGAEVERLAREIPGLIEARMEPQIPIPQLKIDLDRERAAAWGLTPGAINEQISTLLGGAVLAELREGARTIDLVLRLGTEWRNSPERIAEIMLEAAGGRRIPLHFVADVRQGLGPSIILRENAQRRLVVTANSQQRDLAGLAAALQRAVLAQVKLPPGYAVTFEGEFQAQAEATQRIAVAFLLVLAVVLLLLQRYFRSLALAVQVLLNLPLALMGGLALTWLVVDNISVATLVGFIAVGGVAARNGIMMISHYLHLLRHEGERFGEALIIRGTLERLVPVLMTALSAGIALVPLVLAAGAPGKEILHPVAVVIVGGLLSSTLLDLVVTPAVFWLWGRRAAESAVALDAPATH